MNKKIVIVTGSPRKNGNSNAMVKAFTEEAEKLGNKVVIFDTTKLNIKGCTVCNGCFKNGECVINDDFKTIADEISDCDAVVLASPVYWYTFSAQIKAFIDRWYSLFNNNRTFKNKKCILFSCCAEDEIETFDGILFAFGKSVELMGGEILAEVLVPGVNSIGDIEKTDGLKKAKEIAKMI